MGVSTSTEFHILGRAVWQSSTGTLPASLPSLVGCSSLITDSEQDRVIVLSPPAAAGDRCRGQCRGGQAARGTMGPVPGHCHSHGAGRGGAGRGGWPLWHCAGPRAGHHHPAMYPRCPRPDTRSMRCFLMLRVALLVLLMPRVPWSGCKE